MAKFRFQQSGLAAVIWNPKTKTALAKFFNGVFETDDSHVSNKLISLGYKQIGAATEAGGSQKTDEGPSPKPATSGFRRKARTG